MFAGGKSNDNAPLAWVGKVPIYLSTALAIAHAVTMALTAVALASGAESLFQELVFSSPGILKHFALWQFVTYAFIHFPPYWFFLLELYLLAVFGREIERYVGRRAFLGLYVTLLLLPPLALTIAGALGFSSTYAGSSALHFAIFLAFAALYPTAEIFFSLQARWVALALFAVNALQCLAFSDFISLGVLVLDGAAAYIIVESLCGRLQLPRLTHANPTREKELPIHPIDTQELYRSIDPILDKISRSGMASLTAQERQRLEKARAVLSAQDKNH